MNGVVVGPPTEAYRARYAVRKLPVSEAPVAQRVARLACSSLIGGVCAGLRWRPRWYLRVRQRRQLCVAPDREERCPQSRYSEAYARARAMPRLWRRCLMPVPRPIPRARTRGAAVLSPRDSSYVLPDDVRALLPQTARQQLLNRVAEGPQRYVVYQQNRQVPLLQKRSASRAYRGKHQLPSAERNAAVVQVQRRQV